MLKGNRKKKPQTDHIDFMSIAYHLNQEPLNLGLESQRWFNSVFQKHKSSASGSALILGAVTWMANSLAENFNQVHLIDASLNMLERIRQEASEDCKNKLHLINARWTDMGDVSEKYDVVFGDNSFTYLKFPQEWDLLAGLISKHTAKGGLLLLRSFSAPSTHRSESINEIVDCFLKQERINFTEVRTRLLFSNWDARTFNIYPEEVLNDFEKNKSKFNCLLNRHPEQLKNDLETISKYRNSKAVYAAPPLEEIVKVLGSHFEIVDVHYGPYAMTEYFPLVVARKN